MELEFGHAFAIGLVKQVVCLGVGQVPVKNQEDKVVGGRLQMCLTMIFLINVEIQIRYV